MYNSNMILWFMRRKMIGFAFRLALLCAIFLLCFAMLPPMHTNADEAAPTEAPSDADDYAFVYESIESYNIPQAAAETEYWSLMNLILVVAVCGGCVILIVKKLAGRPAYILLYSIAPIAMLLLLLSTQGFEAEAEWFDQWTPLFVIMTIIAASLFFSLRYMESERKIKKEAADNFKSQY